jgi:hypothetical protein
MLMVTVIVKDRIGWSFASIIHAQYWYSSGVPVAVHANVNPVVNQW